MLLRTSGIQRTLAATPCLTLLVCLSASACGSHHPLTSMRPNQAPASQSTQTPRSVINTAPERFLGSWNLVPYFYRFRPSPELCKFIGKKVAIVPAPAENSSGTIREAVFSTASPGVNEVAGTVVRFRVNSGEPKEVRGFLTPTESIYSEVAATTREFGFVVVDRQFVSKVLEEQDIQASIAQQTGKLGSLLGADVLQIIRAKMTPKVLFAASSLAYAYMCDMVIEVNEDIVSVHDGVHLGSTSLVTSVFGALGYSRLEARTIGVGADERVAFFACNNEACVPTDSIDQAREFADLGQKGREEELRKWRELCSGG